MAQDSEQIRKGLLVIDADCPLYALCGVSSGVLGADWAALELENFCRSIAMFDAAVRLRSTEGVAGSWSSFKVRSEATAGTGSSSSRSGASSNAFAPP